MSSRLTQYGENPSQRAAFRVLAFAASQVGSSSSCKVGGIAIVTHLIVTAALVGITALGASARAGGNRISMRLELAVAALMQRAFRNRSERYLHNPNQLRLDFKDSDDAADAAEGLAQAVQESRMCSIACRPARPTTPHSAPTPGDKHTRRLFASTA